ncbi:hypothetical protein [Paracoccus yeei]|uniref:Cellulose biosynthesis protein BcsN n=1 Tax=Paracoccus yeei TaxID=147645 RepID=A0A2D2C6V0_9RHOB|nr:hypothetical protein [Paracoccus yeei]ATQ58206.1 hypothetical protein PYTT13_20365 [Paracoccus yeei]
MKASLNVARMVQRARISINWGALLVTVACSGCVSDVRDLSLTPQQIRERTPFASLALTQAWINAPDMRSVLQRGLGDGAEQHIGLANRTPVPGDNLVMLRTRNVVSGFGRLRFESLVASFGGLPQPFSSLSSGDLMQAEDEIGAYFWATHSAGGATCVLGMRRMNSGMRQLPGNAGVMDVMLRNCVPGSQEDALAPLLADSIGVPPIARDVQGGSRLLSPLAGPAAAVVTVPGGRS